MDDWEFSDHWWHDTPQDKAETEAFVALWNSGNRAPETAESAGE